MKTLSKTPLSTAYPYTVHLLLVLCLFACLTSAQANNSDNPANKVRPDGIKLRWVTYLPADDDFVSVVNGPSPLSQFFAVSRQGRIVTIDPQGRTQLFLDIFEVFGEKLLFDDSKLGLYNLSFHPNFSKAGEVGFGKFYTAHAEVVDKNDSIQQGYTTLGDIDTAHHFDVIYEWTSVDQQIDKNSVRKILHIARTGPEQNVVSMAFKPNIKSWEDEFGQLYIGLGGAGEKTNPSVNQRAEEKNLSGSILRINPQRYGSRAYTPSSDNPFLKDNKHLPEVWAFGLDNMQGFLWDTQGFMWDTDQDGTMLINDDDPNGNQEIFVGLAGANYGSGMMSGGDWVENQDKVSDSQSQHNISKPAAFYNNIVGKNIIPGAVYQGNVLRHLQGYYIFADTHSESLLLLSTQYLKYDEGRNVELLTVKGFWQIRKQNGQYNLVITSNVRGEIYVLNKNGNQLYVVDVDVDVGVDVDVDEVAAVNTQESAETLSDIQSPENNYTIVLIILSIAGVIVFILMTKKLVLLQKPTNTKDRYNRVQSSDDEQHLLFFNKGDREPRLCLAVSDLRACRLLLNNQVILRLSKNLGQELNVNKEQSLRLVFNEEQERKMKKGKARQITLVFWANSLKKPVEVDAYYLMGQRRTTRMSYQDCFNHVLRLTWLVAKQINAVGAHNKPDIQSNQPDIQTNQQ